MRLVGFNSAATPVTRTQQDFIHRSFTVVQWLAGVTVIGLSVAKDVDPKAPSDILKFALPVLLWLKPAASGTLPLLTAVIGAAEVAKKRLGSPVIWEAIHSMLDEFRSKVFPNDPTDFEHRVTLFRHHCFAVSLKNKLSFIWPIYGWLTPVERSGERTQSASVLFSASKEKPKKAEGFAGLVWSTNMCQSVNDLPGLTANSPEPDIKRYAQAVRCSWKPMRRKIRSGKAFARSYWGIPIEVDGKLWGVLVIDSMKEQLQGKDDIKAAFAPFGTCISKLLKGLGK